MLTKNIYRPRNKKYLYSSGMPAIQIQVDALLFQSPENGMAFALKGHRAAHPDVGHHWGVRPRIEVSLPHDCWHLYGQYLHFHSRTTEEVCGALLPEWGHPMRAGFSVAAAQSRWRLHLGFFDVGLSRWWAPSPCLELTPYLALRGAGVRHKLRVDYAGTEVEDLSMKNKFWGIGPQAGLAGVWRLCKGLGIFGRGAMSLLFGEIYVHQDQETVGHKALGRMKFLETFDQTYGVWEGALGLEMRRGCFYARAGWELYWLPGQNQLAHFVSGRLPAMFIANQGDLALVGWSLGIGAEF
jgi:hypothetical protein